MKKRLRKLDLRYVFAGVFVVVGLILLAISQAAVPVAHFEPENSGTKQGVAVTQDSTASNSQYLQFGSSQTTTPTDPNPTVSLGECGGTKNTLNNGTAVRRNFPHAGNTGPKVVPTKTHTGQMVITEAGKVIDGYTIKGQVMVRAQNVTIRNSVIYGQGNFVVDNVEGGSNLTVEDSVICGYGTRDLPDQFNSPCDAVIGASNYTVRRSNLSGCNDILKASNRVEAYDNYMHDNYTHRLANGSGTHNDTVQMRGNTLTRFIFSGNSAYEDPCASNRHFQLAPTVTPVIGGYLRIQNNFFYGIKVFNLDRGYKSTDGLISGNTYAGSASRSSFSPDERPHIYAGDGMGSVGISGNVWEQGGAANRADIDRITNYVCAPI